MLFLVGILIASCFWKKIVRIPTRNSTSMIMSRMLGAGNPHRVASLSCSRVVERHFLEHEKPWFATKKNLVGWVI